eukprot:8381660-Alexandrium_andersonii.AAC.1
MASVLVISCRALGLQRKCGLVAGVTSMQVKLRNMRSSLRMRFDVCTRCYRGERSRRQLHMRSLMWGPVQYVKGLIWGARIRMAG